MDWIMTSKQLPEENHSRQVLFVVYDEQYESNRVKLGTFGPAPYSDSLFKESGSEPQIMHQIKYVVCWMPLPELPELPQTTKPKKKK